MLAQVADGAPSPAFRCRSVIPSVACVLVSTAAQVEHSPRLSFTAPAGTRHILAGWRQRVCLTGHRYGARQTQQPGVIEETFAINGPRAHRSLRHDRTYHGENMWRHADACHSGAPARLSSNSNSIRCMRAISVV